MSHPNKPFEPHEVVVQCSEDIYSLLSNARDNRKTAETKCNVQSSRSHCIFSLKIEGKHPDCEDESGKISGCLNLIDLAGSERVNSSGATGERLKET